MSRLLSAQLVRRVRKLLSIAAAVAALLVANTAEGQDTVPRLQAPPSTYVAPDSLNGDTLHVSPWIAKTLAEYNPQADPRVFCITSFVKWDHYVYLRHIRPNEPMLRCIGDEPMLVQSGQCPPAEIVPISPAQFVLIQCGCDPDNIKFYTPSRTLPNITRKGGP